MSPGACGEDLTGVNSITFDDGSTQTSAATGGGGNTLADWITNIYTTDGRTYEPTWSGLLAANDDLDASGGGVIYLPTHTLLEPDSTLTVGTNVYISGPTVTPIRKRLDSPAWPRIRPLGDTTPFKLTI